MFSEILIGARCPRCAALREVAGQIRFGNLRGNVYRVGDEVVWGRPESGVSGTAAVAVLAFGTCDLCKFDDWRLDVILVNDVIRSVRSPSTIDYPEDGYLELFPSGGQLEPNGQGPIRVCPGCNAAADLSVSESVGVYEAHCRACGYRHGGTVSYPLADEELAEVQLLVSCSENPSAGDLNALRRIFPVLANDGLQALRERLASSPSLALGPFSLTAGNALAAEARASGLIVCVRPSAGS